VDCKSVTLFDTLDLRYLDVSGIEGVESLILRESQKCLILCHLPLGKAFHMVDYLEVDCQSEFSKTRDEIVQIGHTWDEKCVFFDKFACCEAFRFSQQ
jgi:hypothetical protein